MNIVISLAPIDRGTLRKSVDTLCYYQKCYIRTLSYHLPALITPFIRIVKKEVGGETGINDIAVRHHFIITVFITLGRSVKRFVFHYCRAVYIVLCVTSVDVTVLHPSLIFLQPCHGFHVSFIISNQGERYTISSIIVLSFSQNLSSSVTGVSVPSDIRLSFADLVFISSPPITIQ